MTENIFTEWFDYVDNNDLTTFKSYETAIFQCPTCKALFQMKACLNRTMFPYFGYHPTDGNVQIIGENIRKKNRFLARSCECKEYPKRLTTIESLKSAIEELATKFK